jgi:preprotein translocase subunit SecE
MFTKLSLFLRESKQELQRVNWPTTQETVRLTGVVVGVSLVIAVFLGVADMIFLYLLQNFII